jgi:UDP-N-acetylmuramoyl-tripeptide--D-alanyl-D-alanine ligase
MKKFSSKIFLWYLRMAAKIQLKKMKATIIGIGGSAGKTSLCRILETILKEKYKVKASRGLNSETGIPLSILKLPPKDYSFFDWLRIIFLIPLRLIFDWEKYDFCISEMAIDRPNDMEYLLKIVKPKIATLTNITMEHSENFDKLLKKNEKNREKKILDLIEKEEGLLLKSLSSNSIAVLNIDDQRIANLQNKIKAKKITISQENKNADFFAKKIKISPEIFEMEIIHKNKSYFLKLKRPLSRAYIYTILLAIAIANVCNVKIEDSIKTIEKKFKLPPGRLSLFEGIKNTIIIDSSYNAQPIAMIDALDFLSNLGRNKRKVAILGDMRELGKESEKMHQIVANEIIKNVDFPILIGPLMKKYVVPILKKEKKDYKSFNNFTEAKDFILNSIKENDIILVKGSQNTLLLERVVEMLLKDKKDIEKLCRRKPSWEKKRKRTP